MSMTIVDSRWMMIVMKIGSSVCPILCKLKFMFSVFCFCFLLSFLLVGGVTVSPFFLSSMYYVDWLGLDWLAD